MKEKFHCRAINLEISSVHFIFFVLILLIWANLIFQNPKRQEFVAFLGLFYLIWISCKNIELFQTKKSNLFPDFSLDLGNPASNLEGQEMNLDNLQLLIITGKMLQNL
jgi:hypothetical protein